MPNVKNKQFRAKSIRGAKVEDVLIFLEQQLNLSQQRSDDPYYRSKREVKQVYQ